VRRLVSIPKISPYGVIDITKKQLVPQFFPLPVDLSLGGKASYKSTRLQIRKGLI
jgi:hypothetical protein